MKGWKEVNIGSIGEIITGNTPPTKNRAFYNGVYPFIKPTDMDKDSRHVKVWEETYSELAFKKYKSAYIPKGATGVVTIGTVGEKIFQADRPCFTNQSINVVIPNENYDEDFVYYLLKYNLFKVANANPGTASGRDHVSKSNFSSIKVIVPTDKVVQQKIGSILSAYDGLIENNNKRITLLELMAKQIYKEWFVRMRFPGYENAEFQKGLPKGWEIKKLFDALFVDYGFPFQSELFNEVGNGLQIIRIRDLIDGNSDTFTPELASEKYLVHDGDILVGMDGDFHFCKWANGKAWLNQRNLRFRAKQKNLGRYFIYHSTKPQIEFLNEIIVGTTVAHLSDKDLKKLKLIIPTEDLVIAFMKIVEPIYDQEIILKQEIKLLKETRDLLLPRLISGKLRIKEINERQVATA